jgi:hypothetical protein
MTRPARDHPVDQRECRLARSRAVPAHELGREPSGELAGGGVVRHDVGAWPRCRNKSRDVVEDRNVKAAEAALMERFRDWARSLGEGGMTRSVASQIPGKLARA